ncbi:MAG: hypothetical protein PF447_04385 [Spirochaetaceae bacterium]|jgi:tetratricopeptide (TPR) repeat protein|nr:hypothetical protein [Spirochaetaceae bacterium]
MAKRLIPLLFLLFISCKQIGPSFFVFKGNYLSRQGQFQHAELDYLKALKQISAQDPLIYYNKANVYYSLGERESALNDWSLADDYESKELQFRLNFNRGVLYYDLGDYPMAYMQFKQALLLKPGDLHSKINLELSLAKMGDGTTPKPSPQREEQGLMDDTERLLFYIENKETYQWQNSSEDIGPTSQDW